MFNLFLFRVTRLLTTPIRPKPRYLRPVYIYNLTISIYLFIQLSNPFSENYVPYTTSFIISHTNHIQMNSLFFLIFCSIYKKYLQATIVFDFNINKDKTTTKQAKRLCLHKMMLSILYSFLTMYIKIKTFNYLIYDVYIAGQQVGRHMFLVTLCTDSWKTYSGHSGSKEPQKNGRRRPIR